MGNGNSMEVKDYLHILKQYWGYDSFRGIQEEIIQSIGRGEDTLGLMPTGGGKSITFQVPALATEGLCLVITPLIALMKDQVENLRKRDIKALAIYAGMNREEVLRTLENCIFGNYKFLYISPERLSGEFFRNKLKKMPISFITVDESHCISQWGYDFRPAYLKIAEIRQLLPGVPVLALTATATPEVVKDIQQKLGFRKENVFRMSFERKNLSYVVRQCLNKCDELIRILHKVQGCCIVYVHSRKGTKEVADLLNANHITADFYHGGLDNVTRDIRQSSWLRGSFRVMVATNAFGMGIDKPDVRMVIHLDLPEAIEAYFQEAGRAGRDGEKAYAVILTNPMDQTLLKRKIANTFPPKEYVREVYEKLQYYYQMAMGDGLGCRKELDLIDFSSKFKLSAIQAHSALNLLTLAGYLDYAEDQSNSSRLRFLLTRHELYKLRQMDEASESLIQQILRHYPGLFTDYVYINEKELSAYTGLTPKRVYDLLTHLSALRLVSYIPRKDTPIITYTRERVETDEIYLSPHIYEERKERYTRRIEAMIDYVSHSDVCRSRFLLHYLGQKESHNCGICDVCLTRPVPHIDGTPEEVYTTLLQLLSQKSMTLIDLQRTSTYSSQQIAEAMNRLTDEGKVRFQEGKIVLVAN